MDTIGAAFGREVQGTLEKLSEEAQRERLECAVVMLNDLRTILAEEDHKGAPTGYLTVQGWTKLLNVWENSLLGASARKIKYTVEFMADVLGRKGMYAPPMAILLGEMKSFLESVKVSSAAGIQVAA
jgi:hypothetical protein